MKTSVLLILKPDCLRRGIVELVLDRYLAAGFTIDAVGYRTVDRDLILAHYAESIARIGPELETRVLNSYVGRHMVPVVLGYEGAEGIAKARLLTGATDPSKAAPGTIRGDLGNDTVAAAIAGNRVCENLVHCSDSEESFQRELALWFRPETKRRFPPPHP